MSDVVKTAGRVEIPKHENSLDARSRLWKYERARLGHSGVIVIERYPNGILYHRIVRVDEDVFVHGVSLGDGEGEGVGLGVGDGEGVGDGLGEGVGLDGVAVASLMKSFMAVDDESLNVGITGGVKLCPSCEPEQPMNSKPTATAMRSSLSFMAGNLL